MTNKEALEKVEGYLTSCLPIGDYSEVEEIMTALKQKPQPKTGYWISVDTGKRVDLKDGIPTESVKCSECDEWLVASDEYDCIGNYCPNCGIKMEMK